MNITENTVKSIEIDDLYTRFNEKMIVYLTGFTGNRDLSEDIVQDSWVKVMNKLDTYREIGSVEGWIRKIMKNTLIDYFRNNKESDQKLPDIPVEYEYDFDDNIFEVIKDAINQLSDQNKKVFMLISMDEYSHREVSEYLGISIGTSKSNYHKARKKLQQCLKSYIQSRD